MPDQERDGGKFSLKGDTPRKLRSILLTDFTWKVLNDMASEQDMSRGDYLEALAHREIELEESDKETEFDFDVDEVGEILKEARKLKANAGGKIKREIEKALELMGIDYEDD